MYIMCILCMHSGCIHMYKCMPLYVCKNTDMYIHTRTKYLYICIYVTYTDTHTFADMCRNVICI